MSLFAEFPELDLTRFFAPAEVGMLAGISPEKQRQYRHRGIVHFLNSDRDDGRHSRFDWSEVSLWALMAEVSSYGFDLESSAYFAAGFTNLPEIKKIRTENKIAKSNAGQILEHDFRLGRRDRDKPLYIICRPVVGEPVTFVNSSTSDGQLSIASISEAFGSRFGFWMNYSDFQHRLLLRYESIRAEGI